MTSTQPHYLVICVGTTGDIHPFVRVAQSLQALGRNVTLITNTYHSDLLDRSGLTYVGLGTNNEYLRIIQDPDIWHPRRGFSALLAHYKDQLLQLDTAIRSTVTAHPTIAISHPFAVPGAAIAREQGTISKIVSMHLAPSTLRTCHDPLRIGEITVPHWVPMSWRRAYWRFVERGWVDPVAVKQINEARLALNLPPLSASFLTHIEAAPDLTVTLFPTWFGQPMPDWPRPLLSGDFQLFDVEAPGNFTAELSNFLTAGERPLVFTPGTGNLHAREFFSCALASVAELGQRAIFLTKDHSQVPSELPANVLWQPYVPLSSLLPLAKALIHHGGVGTTAEALRAGTPQLVTPFAWDQFDNAARVADLGAGFVIPATKLTSRRLVRTIRQLVETKSVQSRCQQVALHFSQRQDPLALCIAMETTVMNGTQPSAAVPVSGT